MNALLLLLTTVHGPAGPLHPHQPPEAPLIIYDPGTVEPPGPPGDPPLRYRVWQCYYRVTTYFSGVAYFYDKHKIPTWPGPTPAYMWAFENPPMPGEIDPNATSTP